MRRAQLEPLLLVLLGALALGQMVGDLTGNTALKALAAATGASPAPRVFSAVRGLETYSTRFSLHWKGSDGTERSLVLTPEVAQRLRGPYNRRNVFGAALAYGPILGSDPRTRPMMDAVLAYALCAPAPLVHELLQGDVGAGSFRLCYEPLRPEALGDLPLEIEVGCP